MRTKILSTTLMLVCLCTSAFAAVGWDDTSTDEFGPSMSTAAPLGGYHYRVKANGWLLRKPAGGDEYEYLESIIDVPAKYRPEIIRMYERYVGQNAEGRPSVMPKAKRNRHALKRGGRDVIYVDQDRLSVRNRESVYTAYTEGRNAPIVFQGDGNYQSPVTTNITGMDDARALAIHRLNARLVDRLVASSRETGYYHGIVVDRDRQPIHIENHNVNINDLRRICKVEKQVAPTPPPPQPAPVVKRPPCVRLKVVDGKCGKWFLDEQSRLWTYRSGRKFRSNPLPKFLTGRISTDENGNLSFSTGGGIYIHAPSRS